MSTVLEPQTSSRLAPTLESVLARLRRSIRRYVWADAAALLVIVLGLCFWFSLAFDWLFEPPAPLRVALLVAAAFVIVWVPLRYIVRRAFVRLSDRNMAVLLERRFGQFQDSLLTTVELAELPAHAHEFNPEMLVHTQDQALERAGGLQLREVFNLRPLLWRIVLAVLLVASILALGVRSGEVMGTWARRSLLLSNELWPRRTHLSVEGFDAAHRVKLARGADFELLVRAETGAEREVPELVEIRYVQGGARGRDNMSQQGQAVPGRDEYQSYNYTFKDVLTPVEFYVRGGDDRQGPYFLDVVDSPTVGQLTLHCQYPEYMHRETRDIPVAGAMQVPRGCRVTVDAQTNKDIVLAQIDDVSDEQAPITHKIDLAGRAPDELRTFQYVIDSLDSDKVLRFTLVDTDGIHSRDPVRLALAATPDDAPQLSVQLHGIGTAITAQARLPLIGEISDDYGLAKAWFAFHVDDGEPRQQAFRAAITGQDRLPIDEALEVESLQLKPKQKLHLAAEAADTYALAGGPNRAASQSYVLDVVTPEQLRSLLEARELVLRRRFETIIQDTTENRDALVRMDFGKPIARDGAKAATPADKEGPEGQVIRPAATDAPGHEPGVEPGDKPRAAAAEDQDAPAEDVEAAAERQMALRRVHAERALQNAQRAADETLGVAGSFDTIREELVNNRVDTEELKARLKDGIADPLKRISGEMFPELERRLRVLQAQLADPAAGAAAQAAARDQADAILVEMNTVLGRMVELETFNEVLDLLRGIIQSQEGVNDRTRQKQKEKLRRLIEEE